MLRGAVAQLVKASQLLPVKYFLSYPIKGNKSTKNTLWGKKRSIKASSDTTDILSLPFTLFLSFSLLSIYRSFSPPPPPSLSLHLSFSRRRFDLQNTSRVERNVEMFAAVEKALVQVITVFIDDCMFIYSYIYLFH